MTNSDDSDNNKPVRRTNGEIEKLFVKTDMSYVDWRNACRTRSFDGLERLSRLLVEGDDHVFLKALQLMIEQGWGKPAQAITGADGGPIKVQAGVVYLPAEAILSPPPDDDDK